MKITYLTGNDNKFAAAQKGLAGLDITLVQHKLDTPEIQAETVAEIGGYKSRYAANLIHQPVVVSDGGFYFHGLNGFPGPFIKYVNKWLTANDMLALLNGKSDRRIEAIECLSYCEPGAEPIIFTSSLWGTASLSAGKKGWSPINQIFIPAGYDRVASEISDEEMLDFWGKGLNWGKFAEWWSANKSDV